MSDDESDDDLDDDLDDSSDSDAQKLSDSDDEETKGNLGDSSDEETANQKKKEITKGYKMNKKNDNFVSNGNKNKKKERKTSLTEENVETWLLSSGLSASTCTKLITNGYDTMDLFAACCQDDIDSICAEFNLSKEEREKLQAAINKLLKDTQMNDK